MDVLQYSAFNQQVALRKELKEQTKCFRDLTHVAGAGGGGGESAMIEWLCEIEPCLRQYPVEIDGASVKYWDCIPTGTGWTGGTKSCDNTGYWRCGCCCEWTVPSGVNCARFQLWGAGGGSGGGYQCSGSVWGETGAYASVIMKVCPGWQYTLCSGCAYCCYPSQQGQGRNQGCASYVQGCGLCYFCADGGGGSMYNWMASVGKGAPYRTGNVCCHQSGSCFCSGGTWYRMDNSCAICQGPIEYVGGSNYNGCLHCTSIYCPGSAASQDGNSIVYGIRGIWPKWCYDTNHYGWGDGAPVYGFENCTRCCFQWSSGTCCGCYCSAWYSSCMRVPGTGGWPSITMGDNRSGCGDAGTNGMVCVSYK